MPMPRESTYYTPAKTIQNMMAMTVILSILFLILNYLYLRIKNCLFPTPRTHFLSSPDFTRPKQGLHPSLISALPSASFRPEDFDGGIECSVCLTELTEREKVRVLPNCGHGFHLECIDMWLCSNNTCPLCRAAVCGGGGGVLPVANVMAWGASRSRVVPGGARRQWSLSSVEAAAASRDLVIDMPSGEMAVILSSSLDEALSSARSRGIHSCNSI